MRLGLMRGVSGINLILNFYRKTCLYLMSDNILKRILFKKKKYLEEIKKYNNKAECESHAINEC